MSWKVFTIDPGTASMKAALFDGEAKLYSFSVSYGGANPDGFAPISELLPRWEERILKELEKAGIDLSNVDAFCGRGGGLLAVEGGTYTVNETMLDHSEIGANGIHHPARLGPQLAHRFAVKYGKPAFVVDPPETDELQDVARMTGIKGVYRNVRLHALSLKEMAARHARSQGEKYEEHNYIVCHLGGGISVSAHLHGQMVDGNDTVGGEGPMTPTRCGAVPAAEIVRWLQKSGKTTADLLDLCVKNGGFIDHLGTGDGIEVTARAANGDREAAMVWDTMVYQINKSIGSMASVLSGNVDAILLGGGLSNDHSLVEKVREVNGWIAPVYTYPGDLELEAMASAVIRVLSKEETPKEYTGIPRWRGFDF